MGATAVKMMMEWQRRRIYGLARALDMSTRSPDRDDDLHLLVDGIAGRPSLQDLTFDEANRIIAELEHRSRFGAPTTSARKEPAEKPGGVSIGQQRKIIALMCELRKLDEKPNYATIEKRVAGIIRRELKITATEQDPYAWLTYRHGLKLIEIIKGYLESARRRAQARSDTG